MIYSLASFQSDWNNVKKLIFQIVHFTFHIFNLTTLICFFQMKLKTGIVFLIVVFLGVLCTGEGSRCRPGIWCNNDEIKAKLARREEITRDRELKHGYRRINGVKRGYAANNIDIEREFKGYFGNY